MIDSRKKLQLYLKIDLMMNRGFFSYSITKKLKQIFVKDYIMKYLRTLRYYEYSTTQKGLLNSLRGVYYHLKLRSLGMKLGFSIEPNVFDCGLVIPHYGTIVVGAGNRIGKYCVLHTSTCITVGKKNIGDGLYLSTGAKIIRDIKIENNISVAANSVVNSDVLQPNGSLAGMPAIWIKESKPWYERDGEDYIRRISWCRDLYNRYIEE